MNAPRPRSSVVKNLNPLTLMNSKALAKTDTRHQWLVEGILVANQPAVIGGPQKSHKTSIAIDLAISMGTSKKFLNRFPIPEIRRVALYSGESGVASIKETISRVCKSKGVVFEKCKNNFWQFSRPKFCSDESIAQLVGAIESESIQVVIIDPLYLCLTGGSRAVSPTNLYEVGPALLNLAEAVLNAGATPILIHHTVKSGDRNSNQPLGLGDLAYSGIGEFARQWLLVNRRAAFDSNMGTSRLLFTVGGSAGHSGTWNLDIVEGRIRRDFSGRTWTVKASEVRGDDEDEFD